MPDYYVVRTFDATTGTETLHSSVWATGPEEAMLIVERSGVDYTEAEVSLNGQQIAVYDGNGNPLFLGSLE